MFYFGGKSELYSYDPIENPYKNSEGRNFIIAHGWKYRSFWGESHAFSQFLATLYVLIFGSSRSFNFRFVSKPLNIFCANAKKAPNRQGLEGFINFFTIILLQVRAPASLST